MTETHSESRNKPEQNFFLTRRRPSRSSKKFLIVKTQPALCPSQGEDIWDLKNGSHEDTSPRILNYSDSIDDIFRLAAEKVNHKIVIDRRIYGGAPCVVNTRVPVYAILELVEAGYSHKKILKSFPTIGKEGLEAALQFAVLVMER